MVFLSPAVGILFKLFPFLYQKRLRDKVRSSSYYRSRLCRVASWEKLQMLMLSKPDLDLQSKREIQFREVAFGTKSKQVRKILGKPRFVVQNETTIAGHTVYFYRFNYSGIIAKCEVHFLDDEFFLATYSFHRTLDGNSAEIKRILMDKYTGHKEPIPFETTARIKDEYGGTILIEKDVELMITYLPGDKKILERVIGQVKQKEIDNQRFSTNRISMLQEIL